MSSPTGIGASVKRREDVKFLKGAGRYTDDMNLPNQTFCYFLRSNVAHAKIKSLNTSAAEQAPGVVAVLTGAHFKEVGGLPCGWLITGKNEQPMVEPPVSVHVPPTVMSLRVLVS